MSGARQKIPVFKVCVVILSLQLLLSKMLTHGCLRWAYIGIGHLPPPFTYSLHCHLSFSLMDFKTEKPRQRGSRPRWIPNSSPSASLCIATVCQWGWVAYIGVHCSFCVAFCCIKLFRSFYWVVVHNDKRILLDVIHSRSWCCIWLKHFFARWLKHFSPSDDTFQGITEDVRQF